MRARRRFLKRPSRKHLRALRTAARHLRSIDDDFGALASLQKRKRLRAVAEAAADARRSRALFETLRDALDTRERVAARDLLERLRECERDAVTKVRRLLRGLKYE